MRRNEGWGFSADSKHRGLGKCRGSFRCPRFLLGRTETSLRTDAFWLRRATRLSPVAGAAQPSPGASARRGCSRGPLSSQGHGPDHCQGVSSCEGPNHDIVAVLVSLSRLPLTVDSLEPRRRALPHPRLEPDRQPTTVRGVARLSHVANPRFVCVSPQVGWGTDGRSPWEAQLAVCVVRVNLERGTLQARPCPGLPPASGRVGNRPLTMVRCVVAYAQPAKKAQ